MDEASHVRPPPPANDTAAPSDTTRLLRQLRLVAARSPTAAAGIAAKLDPDAALLLAEEADAAGLPDEVVLALVERSAA